MASGRNTIDYMATGLVGDDQTTMDMSKANAYKSAAKIKMGKRGGSITVRQSPDVHNRQPIPNSTWDDVGGSSLPKVKGAHR